MRAVLAILMLALLAGGRADAAGEPRFTVLVPSAYLNLDDTHALEIVAEGIDPARVEEVRLVVRGESAVARRGDDPEWRTETGWAIPIVVAQERLQFRVEVLCDGQRYVYPERGWATIRARPRWQPWLFLIVGWSFCLAGLPPAAYWITRRLNRRARPDVAIKLALTAGLAAGYLWFAILFGYSGFAGTGSDVPFIAGGLALVVLAIVILFR